MFSLFLFQRKKVFLRNDWENKRTFVPIVFNLLRTFIQQMLGYFIYKIKQDICFLYPAKRLDRIGWNFLRNPWLPWRKHRIKNSKYVFLQKLNFFLSNFDFKNFYGQRRAHQLVFNNYKYYSSLRFISGSNISLLRFPFHFVPV